MIRSATSAATSQPGRHSTAGDPTGGGRPTSNPSTSGPSNNNPSNSGPSNRRPLGPDGGRLGRLLARLRRDAGMNTAEYAVGTLAAVAFAGLLLKVLTSNSVQAALSAVIARALK